MISIEQLVYGVDPNGGSPSRTLLGMSPGMSREVAGEIQRLCDGWGQAPELGLQHPALLSFPLENTMSSLRGRLYAVIRVGAGISPVFHAAVLADPGYALLGYNPFALSGTGFFAQEWTAGHTLPRRQLTREEAAGTFALSVSAEDVGLIDEGLHKLLAENSLTLPIEQSVGTSDRILALILAVLPLPLRKNQRFATFTTSELNRYTLAARETEGSSCAGWKRWFMAQPDSPLDARRAAYVKAVRDALIAGSLAGIEEAARDLQRGPAGPSGSAPARSARGMDAPLRPTVTAQARPPATIDRRPAAGPMREANAPVPAPRKPRACRTKLVRQPVRISRVAQRRLPGSIAMSVVVAAALVAAYSWLSHGGVDGGFGWAVLKDRLSAGARPRSTTLLEVVNVGRTYDRLVKKVTGAGLADLVDGRDKDRDRDEALAALQIESAAPLLQQSESFRQLASKGIQQGDRIDRETQRLHALDEQGEVLLYEMSRLELAWASLASGADWRDLSELEDERLQARLDSLARGGKRLLEQARRELGTAEVRPRLQSARRQVAAMHQLLEMFQEPRWSPRWESRIFAAAERINPSASELTRAYRNAAFELVRLKKAERSEAHRQLPFTARLETAVWPGAEVRDILPNLRTRARKFGAARTPDLLADAVRLYESLSDPDGLEAAMTRAPDALAALESNEAYRFDPGAYDDYLDRIRFEAAGRLLGEEGDPETLPAVYFVDPGRELDEAFRAALAAPGDADLWQRLAATGGPGFFTRWASREAERVRAERRERLVIADAAYTECVSLLRRLRGRVLDAGDWTALWLDLNEQAERALAAWDEAAATGPRFAQRKARLENLRDALARPRPLPLRAVTVRLAQDELAEPCEIRLQLRVGTGAVLLETTAFPIGPAAPAGSGWVGTATLDWAPFVEPGSTFAATVRKADGDDLLLQREWPSLAERAGPAALARPGESGGSSILFRLDPDWWSGLETPDPDSMQPAAAQDVVPLHTLLPDRADAVPTSSPRGGLR